MNCNIEELCTLKRLKYRRQNTKHLEDKRADHKNVMMVRIIYIKSCAKHRNIAHKLKKKRIRNFNQSRTSSYLCALGLFSFSSAEVKLELTP